MKKYLFTFLLLNFLSFSNDITFKTNSKASIEVNADSAFLTFSIKNTGNDLKKLKKENLNKTDKFLNEIKKKNIEVEVIDNKNYTYNMISKSIGKEEKILLTSTFRYDFKNDEVLNKIKDIDIASFDLQDKYLVITLKEEDTDLKKAYDKLNEKVRKIKKALNDKLSLINFEKNTNAQDVYKDFFELNNIIKLKIADISKLNDIISISKNNDIFLNQNIDFKVSKLDDKYEKLYKKAYIEAKTKALSLLGKEYRIKEVKNITEKKHETPVYYRDFDTMNVKQLRSPLSKNDIEENYINELKIPKIKINNDIVFSFILTDDKKEEKSDKNALINASSSLSIKPDKAKIRVKLPTYSYNNLNEASKKNVLLTKKLKELLKLANIGIKDFQTIDYYTNKFEEINTNLIKNKDFKYNTKLIADIENVNDENFEFLINELEKENSYLKNINYSLHLVIEKEDSDLSKSYLKTKNTFNSLKKIFDKKGIKIEVSNYRNEKKNEFIEEKKVNTKYVVENEVEFYLENIEDISLLVSIFNEMGLSEFNSKYSLDDENKYIHLISDKIKKELFSKKRALENIENVEFGEFKSIEEKGVNSNEFSFFDNFYSIKKKKNIDLEKSNDEILKNALSNLENISIENYNIEKEYRFDINLK